MAMHTAATFSANLHADAADVEFLALRTCNSELNILIRRIVFCCRPCATFTSAYQQAIGCIITILHHSLYLSSSCCGIAINNSTLIAGQRPGSSKRIATTQLYGIHRDIGNSTLFA